MTEEEQKQQRELLEQVYKAAQKAAKWHYFDRYLVWMGLVALVAFVVHLIWGH
jgi:hypothetical protein